MWQLENSSTNYHPIIGLVLLALLLLQPVFGVLHHRVYKKLQKRQVWSYLHLTNGRVVIILGIINGALGLHVSNASDYQKKVYYIVAGIMLALWICVAIWGEIRRRMKIGKAGKTDTTATTAPGGYEQVKQEYR
jgi:sulfite exporter TauE/SafE